MHGMNEVYRSSYSETGKIVKSPFYDKSWPFSHVCGRYALNMKGHQRSHSPIVKKQTHIFTLLLLSLLPFKFPKLWRFLLQRSRLFHGKREIVEQVSSVWMFRQNTRRKSPIWLDFIGVPNLTSDKLYCRLLLSSVYYFYFECAII